MASSASVLSYDIRMIDEIEVAYFYTFSLIAILVTLVYSNLLLLDEEIECIWKRPTRPASWLYVLVRYSGLLSIIASVFLSWSPPKYCITFDRLSVWSEGIALVATYCFQILRTYSIYRKPWILAGLLALATLPVTTYLVNAADSACSVTGTRASLMLWDLDALSDILFESIILGITVSRTWSNWLSTVRLKDSSATYLTGAILKNGILYYLVFVVLQGCEIVARNLQPSVATMKLNSLTGAVAIPLRLVLTCQFILDLRRRLGVQSPIASNLVYPSRPRGNPIELEFGDPSGYADVLHIRHSSFSDECSVEETDRRRDNLGVGIDSEELEMLTLRDHE